MIHTLRRACVRLKMMPANQNRLEIVPTFSLVSLDRFRNLTLLA